MRNSLEKEREMVGSMSYWSLKAEIVELSRY